MTRSPPPFYPLLPTYHALLCSYPSPFITFYPNPDCPPTVTHPDYTLCGTLLYSFCAAYTRAAHTAATFGCFPWLPGVVYIPACRLYRQPVHPPCLLPLLRDVWFERFAPLTHPHSPRTPFRHANTATYRLTAPFAKTTRTRCSTPPPRFALPCCLPQTWTLVYPRLACRAAPAFLVIPTVVTYIRFCSLVPVGFTLAHYLRCGTADTAPFGSSSVVHLPGSCRVYSTAALPYLNRL